jgi:hypothetical protein
MTFDPVKLAPRPMIQMVELARYALMKAYLRLLPGRLSLMELIVAGWLSQAIHAAAALGLADALADGPHTASELARLVDADEDALRRLLRLLVGHGVFAQRRDGSYALTAASRALRGDTAVSLRDAAVFFGSPAHRNQWSHLVEAVRTGRPVGAGDRTMFDQLRTDPEAGEMFDRAMTSIGSLSTEYVLDAYDFAAYGTIVDVGGGQGAFLADILARAPRSRGVLVDLPEVAAAANVRFRAAGLADRVEVRTSSFFESVPTSGDLYVLKHVVHDWPDDRALQILRTVRAAMTPTARLLLVELVLPPHPRPHPAHYIDLEMLINSGGRERTEADYHSLLDSAGLRVTRVIPTIPQSLIEARPCG